MSQSVTAVGFTEFADPSGPRLIEVEAPVAVDGELLVDVLAATVNPADVQFLRGDHVGFLVDHEPPYWGGLEFVGRAGAGLVAGTGHFFPTGRGVHASVIASPIDHIVEVPEGIDPMLAATVPMNGLTAQAVVDRLPDPASGPVVITGAAGAVGGYVAEIASQAGHHVIAVASPADEEALRLRGASEFHPRGHDVVARVRAAYPEGVAAVVDAAMLDEDAMPLVHDGGVFLVLRPGHEPAPARGVEPRLVSFRRYQRRPDVLRSLFERVAAGHLTPRVAQSIGVFDAAAAFRAASAPGLRGRVVMTFD